MNKFSQQSARPLVLLIFLASFLFVTAFQEPQAGGIPPWVWILIIAAVVILLLWLLLRSPRREPQPPPVVEVPPAVAAVPDDLTIIEGIGPKIDSILKAAGITTFSQLAATDVSRIQTILENGGIRLADPGSWPEQARLAAAGDHAGLQELQNRLNAGRQV